MFYETIFVLKLHLQFYTRIFILCLFIIYIYIYIYFLNLCILYNLYLVIYFYYIPKICIDMKIKKHLKNIIK
jgi:hypothetical protein